MPRSLREETGEALASAGRVIAAALIAGLTPAPDLTVSAWAEQSRIVSAESGSPFPGPWRNSLAPYGVEPMDCLSPKHPSTDVTFIGAAQLIKSEIGVNFAGFTVDVDPSGLLIVLPSIDEAQKFNKTKLQPTLEATPSLCHKVKEVKSRDETGSTASFKRFRGGFIQLTHAGSSKGLQAITVKRLWGDEISEFPQDAGGRGDPIEQMRQRFSTFLRLGTAKALWTSTPKLKGSCRITQFYDASDMRRLYWPCPQCGDFFAFRFEHLKWEAPRPPYRAHAIAPCCGSVLEHWQKSAMLAHAFWIKTYAATDDTDTQPGAVVPAAQIEAFRARTSKGRQPGFHLWRGQSAFHDWDGIVADYIASKESPEKLKTFTQQILAEAFEESGEAPDHLKLMARVEERDGYLPEGVLAITGFCDVQQNRLQYGVYGWGLQFSAWRIDGGTIEGDPETDAPWHELASAIAKRYQDRYGRDWPIEAFGVDSGYKSHAVYNFTRRRPAVFATDGRAGATKPLIGSPRRVDVSWRGKIVKGGAMLWPIGVDSLKSALYSSLAKTIDGPDPKTGMWPAGCTRFSRECDERFFQQITAEYLTTVKTRDGRGKQMWVKRAGMANEELDIWVGSRAMASKLRLDRWTPAEWQSRLAMHAPPDDQVQKDLLALAPQTMTPAPIAARQSRNMAVRRTIAPRI